mmetsp:Transcript_7814/g.16060  ORF Transcript_7814/g.16060 Transcript_7814/m.16060 type:complete len:229 (+) Transcript_7814:816-1502(+)
MPWQYDSGNPWQSRYSSRTLLPPLLGPLADTLPSSHCEAAWHRRTTGRGAGKPNGPNPPPPPWRGLPTRFALYSDDGPHEEFTLTAFVRGCTKDADFSAHDDSSAALLNAAAAAAFVVLMVWAEDPSKDGPAAVLLARRAARRRFCAWRAVMACLPAPASKTVSANVVDPATASAVPPPSAPPKRTAVADDDNDGGAAAAAAAAFGGAAEARCSRFARGTANSQVTPG